MWSLIQLLLPSLRHQVYCEELKKKIDGSKYMMFGLERFRQSKEKKKKEEKRGRFPFMKEKNHAHSHAFPA